MKILAIGDFHGKFPQKLKNIPKKEKIDFILSTGDFGGNKELLDIIFKNFSKDWVDVVGAKKAKELILKDYNSGKKVINELNQLGVPIYSVHGNWDFEAGMHKEKKADIKLKKYSEIMKKKKNINFLNKQIKKIKGFVIYGFGGKVTATIYTTKQGPFEKSGREKYKKIHEKEKKQLFNKAKKGIDIFLAHYPPYGVFDKVKSFYKENTMNGKNVGFKPYLEFINKYKPRLFICGHMHEHQGVKKFGETVVISTGAAKDSKAVVIEIDEDKKKKIKIRFVR